jgi:hypothetical protein
LALTTLARRQGTGTRPDDHLSMPSATGETNVSTAYDTEPTTGPIPITRSDAHDRLANRDSSITVMPIEPPRGGIGPCSECPEPTTPDAPAVRDGDVLLDFVTCAVSVVMHRNAVCLPCLPAAMGWLREAGIAEVVIEIPRITNSETARLEYERQLIVHALATGAPAPESSIERWNWIVGQLRDIAGGTRRDPFARMPKIEDIEF